MTWDKHLIGLPELSEYADRPVTDDLAGRVEALIAHQARTWPMLCEGYEGLSRIETRKLTVQESRLTVQFNPRRIRSTAARVDKASIQSRACFLCPEGLPPEEMGLAYGDEFVILCNPFPILDKHLSIVHREHVEQRIEGHAGTLLRLAADLGPSFFVLYNGARCGASAPDHLHFQACSRKLLPIDEDLRASGDEVPVHEDCDVCTHAHRDQFELFMMGDCGRAVVVLRGRNRSEIETWLMRVLESLPKAPDEPEPMINLVCYYQAGEWRVYLFPRAAHRPSSYFAQGADRILVSPGAIDMAGVIVVPERDSFERIDSASMERIFAEVSQGEAVVAGVLERITATLSFGE